MKRVFSVKNKGQGSNSGIFFCWQKTHGNFLATTGYDSKVRIFNRRGEPVREFGLPGTCMGFGWDQDGSFLAAINETNGNVTLFNANTHKIDQVDSGFKDTLTFLTWSKTDNLLAVGTSRGNLLIYNSATQRKIPILGKHTKKISCGAWSRQGVLALGSEDRTITISNTEGDTVRQMNIQGEPADMQFSEMKADERSSGENTISCIKSRKTLYLLNMLDHENPIELAFQQRYGDIVQYKWYRDGYIMIGFSQGYFVVVSTHMKEIGEEIYQVRDHRDALTSISMSETLNAAATAGGNCIKIHDLQDFKEMYAIISVDDERSLDRVDWTEDGQLLAVSSPHGSVHVYLTKLPIIGSSFQTRIAYLTSLLEVTIQDNVQQEHSVSVPIDIEPSFIAVGPYHLAVGMNNRAWFYAITEQGIQKQREHEYLGTVISYRINADYAAALFEGKIQLHMIDEGSGGREEEKEAQLFPDKDQSTHKILCHDLTRDFLIYGTDKGSITYFSVEDWKVVNEYKHMSGIRKLFPDSAGVFLVFIDNSADGFVYNPVNDRILEIPKISPKTRGVLWDLWPNDKGIFIAYDDEKIYTYIFLQDSMRGGNVEYIGETKLLFNHQPLLLHGGELLLQTAAGNVQVQLLDSHAFMQKGIQQPGSTISRDEQLLMLKKALALKRFGDAWRFCEQIGTKQAWEELGTAAMFHLDIEFAIKVYTAIGDVGMVMSLRRIKNIEEKSLLAGYVAMYLGEFNLAQELFLSSSKPVAALEMRRDLMHWDQALQLGQTLDRSELPFISREYAQQLEFTGDYTAALRHYEQAVTQDEDHRDHDEACASGVARTSIRNGDLRRGIAMAMKMPSKSLKKECAAILESMKQYAEAGALYEKGGYYDKAASVYIRAKNLTKVGELLPKVTVPKIHAQYAKAREVEGKYKEAVKAYEYAKDWDNAIRLYLDHLKDPDSAIRIVRQTQSIDGARMTARFFEKLNDFSSAIQFLVMSKCNDEAFRLAQKHGLMEKYADIIGDDATHDDYLSIALHFENSQNHYLAGKFFFLCGQHQRALNHLLNPVNEENSDAINLAVDLVGRANEQPLTRQLINYLMGDSDGNPKDAKYLFRLYLVMKQYREAASTALIIAREEQNAGNYRNAHKLLLSMYQELKKNHIAIPSEMSNNLTILHSYMLGKMFVKQGEHLKAARMLIRVASNISKFPSHVVPILTSTVIECQRSGLKKSAFGYAATLMRPEYREKIDAKYKKKIESIVRKPDSSELEESTSPCPFCDFKLAETELSCSSCKNNSPACIATGRHLIKDDMTVCPSCKFPAILSEFSRVLASEDGRCPMCSELIELVDIEKIADTNKILYPNDDTD